MQRSTSKKMAVIILLVLTAVFIGVGALVLVQVQKNQAPDDASAFGFGKDAITDYFDELDGFFKTVPCGLILNTAIAQYTSKGFGNELWVGDDADRYIVDIAAQESAGKLVKNCVYTEEEEYDPDATGFNPLESLIHLEIRTYDLNSYIYESEEEKIDFVTRNIYSEIKDQGEFPEYKTKYYFGISKLDETKCVGLLLHDTNEFEFATLTYTGYDCESNDTEYRNKVFTKTISSFVNESIFNIYGEAGFNPYDDEDFGDKSKPDSENSDPVDNSAPTETNE